MHIDVYCTASESSDDAAGHERLSIKDDQDDGLETDDSNESNTSTCYTVLRKGADKTMPAPRVRHTRKKSGLPLSLSGKSKLKPVLSYKISAAQLAEAVERRRARGDSTSDAVDDDLFRDLTLTDSASGRSFLLADSTDSSDETERTWRSPQEERLRLQMLEQRKQQWRCAKACDNETNRRSASAHGSSQVSRTNSQRCPTVSKVVEKALPAAPEPDRSMPPGLLKKFGRHVGPARNPDCRCAHCVDHFARLRASKDPRTGLVRA